MDCILCQYHVIFKPKLSVHSFELQKHISVNRMILNYTGSLIKKYPDWMHLSSTVYHTNQHGQRQVCNRIQELGHQQHLPSWHRHAVIAVITHTASAKPPNNSKPVIPHTYIVTPQCTPQETHKNQGDRHRDTQNYKHTKHLPGPPTQGVLPERDDNMISWTLPPVFMQPPEAILTSTLHYDNTAFYWLYISILQ